MSEADIRADRIRKIERLEREGINPYPTKSVRDTSVADFASTFAELEKSGRKVVLAGRLLSVRVQGGIAFADLFDGTGKIQIVLQKPDAVGVTQLKEKAESLRMFNLFVETVDMGDFIEAAGVAYATKRGERSLKVSHWSMLAKSLLPIPDQWYGLKDEELKLRMREIDMLLNPEVRVIVERRARFWQAARAFYLSRGFLEVETPVLETVPGGADARPFITHHNALDIDVYLRISAGELWQKRLLMAGFPKVFEIGRIFRNEGQSREHLQDYTQLESYEAYSDMEKGMTFVVELYRHIAREVYGAYTFTIGEHTVDLADSWETIDFNACIRDAYGVDPVSVTERDLVHAALRAGADNIPNRARAVDYLWKKVRKTVSGPAFLVGVPAYMEPLAKRSPENPAIVERFQVIVAGSEMGKGYSELNDPQDQHARLVEQQKLRDAGDEEAQRLDLDYIRAMEHGMPPAFGFGVSERLFAFLENKPAHLAQLFPLLRPR